MNGLEFLRLILPGNPGGWYVGFAVKQMDGKPARRQQSFQSIETLYRWLVALDRQGFDVYHACAQFRERRVWNQRLNKYELRSRINIAFICCLWFDIDTRLTKKDAKYADPEEAALAVVAFCRVANLPPPSWVSSGGGLHVYWPFATALDLEQWQVLSAGLKRACEMHHLSADPSRTADGSSILRTPDTHHQKTGRTVQAQACEKYDVARFAHLKDLAPDEPARPASLPVPSTTTLLGALVGGLFDEPSDPGIIERECAQARYFAADPGRCDEPRHYAIAGLYHLCGPAGVDAHQSRLAPEYRGLGRSKGEQWITATGGNPPTCEHFENRWPETCQGCPHKGRITTPLQLGRQYFPETPKLLQENGKAAQQPIQIPPALIENQQTGISQGLNGFPILEKPWALHNNQLVWEGEGKGGKATYVVVSEHPIYVQAVHRSEAVNRVSYTFNHLLPQEGWRSINIPAESMGNGRGIPELLANGVVIHEHKLFEKYTKQQVGKFNNETRQKKRFEQCGWKNESN